MKQELKQEIKGFKDCPSWLRLKYRQAVDFRCQGCNKLEKDCGILSPHRIKRGNIGGLYTVYPLNHKLNNIKVVCYDCHRKLHFKEKGVTQ